MSHSSLAQAKPSNRSFPSMCNQATVCWRMRWKAILTPHPTHLRSEPRHPAPGAPQTCSARRAGN
eukprot:83968-Chlamydomonas_euryale.AAC.2